MSRRRQCQCRHHRQHHGPFQKATELSQQRFENAQTRGGRIAAFIDGSSDPSRAHVAWWLLPKCLKEALAYDMRRLSSRTLQTWLQEHEATMRTVASNDVSWRPLQLLGLPAGFAVRLPRVAADATFMATRKTIAPKVPILCLALKREARSVVGEVECRGADVRLRKQGVEIVASGSLRFREAAAQLYDAGPWRKGMPREQLFAFGISVLRALSQQQAMAQNFTAD